MNPHRIATLATILSLSAPLFAGTENPAISVPDGFTVELVAGPPLVDRPIMASFDDRGRLYVSDSAGVNLRGNELEKNPPHRIVVLEDTNHDGIFDKTRVFADKIVFPQGLLWHDGAVFVASPPCLWRYDDTDNDGVCDKRTALLSGFPLTGVSDDMHGACLGPDGFIYTCAGRFPHHIKDIGGKPLEPGGGRQPVLVRCRPDGSGAEIVGGTQGNGVEVAWTDEGDAVVSGTFYGGAGMRDALIHFIEGGDYPVLNQSFTEHQFKSTGEPLPPLVHMVATAPSGITRYRGRLLGSEFENNLFCTYFNLHSVHRHVLTRDGATFRATDEPFLTSSDADFHPTDVLQDDADGSLLVVNTGGWFRIGCPTSQIAKPDVKGGIYRVRRTGMPRGTGKPEAAPCDAVWALAQTDGPAARAATRAALGNASESVRQVAASAAGIHRDAAATDALAKLVTSDIPAVRREAATALGRIGSAEAVPALLAALKGGGGADSFLEHAVIYALIRIGDVDGTTKGLRDGDPAVKRGALLALDQLDGARLTPELITPLLTPAEPALRQAAARVLAHHPEWAASMLPYFREALSTPGAMPEAKQEELRQQLNAFGTDPAVQKLIANAVSSASTSPAVKLLLLETIGQAPAGGLPKSWVAGVRQCLADPDERIVRQAILSIRSLPQPRRPVLTRIDAQVDFVGDGKTDNKPFAGTDLVNDFAVRWTGVVRVASDERYKFTTESDDGSRLFVNGQMVVDNGGRHAMFAKNGLIKLTAGDHDIRLEYFQGRSGKGCRLLWSVAGPDAKPEIVPAGALWHRDETTPDAPPTPGLVGEYFVSREPVDDFLELSAPDFDEALLNVARDAGRTTDLRVDALSTAAPRLDVVDASLFELLLASLEKGKPALLRSSAADAVGRARLSPAQLKTLTETVASAGPMELPKLLAAYNRGGDADLGAALLAAVERSPGSRGLRPEVLRETLSHFPDELRAAAAPLIERLSVTAAGQQARLDEIERTLHGGDAGRGRAVFFGTKAVCATCHTVGKDGGRVGPDLSKIGALRSQRDLLEAVVFPSASFARTFEPYVVKTKDGAVESGVISRETADAFYLTTGPRAEKRVARANVADLRLSPVSIMPEGLDAQLTPQEMADLIEFLRSLK